MHEIVISQHARERMARYKVTEELVKITLESPEITLEGHSGRNIYQRRLNGHLLRVITEDSKGIKIVITIYKAKRERYEI
ncbi:MAG: DUF4258 domain-containing protein [Candidatus Micrarchaeota archaeon]|nr:DUF4258 domain-containing protein [Candidatus Micrarchaeota archaeon]